MKVYHLVETDLPEKADAIDIADIADDLVGDKVGVRVFLVEEPEATWRIGNNEHRHKEVPTVDDDGLPAGGTDVLFSGRLVVEE